MRRMIAPWVLASALAAGTAWGQGGERPPLVQLQPSVTPEGEGFRVAVEGQSRLPDGAVLQIGLFPVEAGGKESPALCTTRAEVKGGGFAINPWRIARAELTVPRYRLEARLADDQAPQLRRSLPRAGGGRVSVEILLGDWRTRCTQLVPLARSLLERMAAVTRYRDDLLAMARELSAKRLTAAEWKAWRGREELPRACAQCTAAMKAPVSTANFPRTCDRGRVFISYYESLMNVIDSEMRGGEGAGNPERKETLKLADAAIPADYLVEFQSVLAPEGAYQMCQYFEELAATLGAAPPSGKAKAPPKAAGPVEKDLQLILTQVKAFYDMTWKVDVADDSKAVLDMIDDLRKLSEELKPAAPAAAAQERAAALRSGVRTRLDQLRGALGRRLGI
jgi:hypothetical protein